MNKYANNAEKRTSANRRNEEEEIVLPPIHIANYANHNQRHNCMCSLLRINPFND